LSTAFRPLFDNHRGISFPARRATHVERVHLAAREDLGTWPSDDAPRRPSAMAVLPTPASPTSSGLFLATAAQGLDYRSILRSRPISGSIFPTSAWRVEVEGVGLEGAARPAASSARGLLLGFARALRFLDAGVW